MAATDVLAATPVAGSPWTNFEEYLDYQPGSPMSTPRLASAKAVASGSSSSASSSAVAAPSAVSDDASSTQASSSVATASAPPPGASPEALFRHYLAIELRKIGSNADDAIIDRYVAQHYSSFTRAMERQQAQQQQQQQQQAAPISALGAVRPAPQDGDMSLLATANAFKSPPPATSPSSAPYLLQGTTTVAPASIEASTSDSMLPSDMHLSSMPQVSMPSNDALVGQMMPPQMSSAQSVSTPSHRSEDAMSEDDNDEDDEDESKDDVKGLPSRRKAATEEVPIAGSIMGPSNELRPDPETYRNLTSKEKRQLRNKISARNFRTRRKEHISHLEQQVADRDTLIEGLRQQLALVNMQNKDLTEEVRQLKSKVISPVDMQRLIDALQKTNVFGPAVNGTDDAEATSGAQQQPSLTRTASNGSLVDTLASSSSASRPMSPRPSSSTPLARPNLRKDVPATQAGVAGAHSFWGGGVGGSAWPVNSSQAVA